MIQTDAKTPVKFSNDTGLPHTENLVNNKRKVNTKEKSVVSGHQGVNFIGR